MCVAYSSPPPAHSTCAFTTVGSRTITCDPGYSTTSGAGGITVVVNDASSPGHGGCNSMSYLPIVPLSLFLLLFL